MNAMLPKARDNFAEFRSSLGRFTKGNPGGGRLNVKRAGMRALMDSIDGHIHTMIADGELDRVVEAMKAKAKEKHGCNSLIAFLRELRSLGILQLMLAQTDYEDSAVAEDEPTPVGITICMYKEEPPPGFDATKAKAAKNPS